MTQANFDIVCLTPAGLDHPAIAVSAARAGGLGILDLEFCRDGVAARRDLTRALDATDGDLGLRIVPAQRDSAIALIDAAKPRGLTVILAARDATATQQTLVALRDAGAARVWIEVTDASQLEAGATEPDGYVLQGHESGGVVGDDTSFIGLQKALRATRKPVLVRGGIGLNTAAACKLAGAAGVVLDDQCLLLRESPLPAGRRTALAKLNGSETRLFGEHLGTTVRVFAPPKHRLLAEAEALEQQAETDEAAAARWAETITAHIGWDAETQLAPIGQGIGVANTLTAHKTVGRLIQALRKAATDNIVRAAEQDALAPDAPLAASHGTRYPVVQGPMTRVSDTAEFAGRVADAGGLPMLALALMRGEQVGKLLEQTRDRLGDKPWGIGLLGFVPQQLREQQIKAVLACKPTFALIAGGRPDQAAHFESQGIPAYIHAPAPALLKMYTEQGARRFVFEGRECGGHIGPIASFPLWEQMIAVLLNTVPAADAADTHILFAGGINDATSAAMVAALAAPLVDAGMKIGVLMGSAYLFTREIVEAGAIVKGFQAEAIACKRTVGLATGPGHASRAADTAFAREFFATRRKMLAEGAAPGEISETLEDLNLGRLRIASKGVNRNADGEIVSIEPDAQHNDGMYMIGQVATLADSVISMTDLHEGVSTQATERLHAWQADRDDRIAAAKPSDIAIIGIGTLLPKAESAEDTWNIVLNKQPVIGEVPKTRWDWELYYDPDKTARDKVYSKWGGFLDEITFDPMAFGIPPKSMKSIDPMQLLCLEATQRALTDAGYADGDFDRENTAIMLGAGGGVGDLGMQYGVRAEIPRFVDAPSDEVWDRLPEWTQESFAGVLQNVAAGRVANRLDFGGKNFTVDAACASSLAAVSIAVDELETGRANVALAGGVDTVQGPFGYLCFSKTQALSPTGTARTFDKNANGIVISEGAAVIVMKRLADAERDGDRIYGVIKAVAGSSDGRALGMTAPRPEGQMRALDRAYAKAGFRPTSLGVIEAHGTGTPVGDKAEAETITRTLRAEGALPQSVSMGSIKTVMGHTKAAAGITGLIKMTLALHHRTLPAHHGVSDPIDAIADPTTPVYLLDEAKPWITRPGEKRRAGVSAFGFGGTNFHAVLEGYDGNLGAADAPAGGNAWPAELFVVRAADANDLSDAIGRLVTALKQGTNVPLRDLAYSLAADADAFAQAHAGQASACAAMVAGDYDNLISALSAVSETLAGGDKPLPAHVHVATNVPAETPGLAFVYPGQGAQYVGMARESALFIDDIRHAVARAQTVLADAFDADLDKYIWPSAAFTDEIRKQQTSALTDTRVAQPAIGTIELGMTALARRLGITPAAAAGHSYGEYVALAAAGVLSQDDCLRLSALRGEVMGEAAATGTAGGMAAVSADRDAVTAAIADWPELRVANHNAPKQTVISGSKSDIDAAVAAMSDNGMQARALPVSGAFHTELVAAAQKPLSRAIRKTTLRDAAFPVYSNTTAKPYPDDSQGQYATLDGHMLNPVEFVAEIQAMHAAGVSVFLELGPKAICSGMIRQTLADTDARAIAVDGNGGGLRGLLIGLAELATTGVSMQVARLFDGRPVNRLQLARLAELVKPAALSPTTWYLSGGCARPMDDPILRAGSQPPLSREQAEAAVTAAKAMRDAAERAHQAPPAAPAGTPATPPAAAGPAAVPAPVSTPTPQATAPVAASGEALAAYQQTMREFLNLQERVMQQYLGGATSATPAAPPAVSVPQVPAAVSAPAAPAATPKPQPVSAQAASAPQPAPAATPEPAQPTPPPAASPAPSPALNRDAIADMMRGIVAELTGYPDDMLDPAQDLEADLGVDSIKRVEILGSLQKQLPESAAAAMGEQMEAFTASRCLNDIVDRTAALIGDAAPADTSASPPAVSQPAAPAPAVDIQAALLGIVAELTGYPEDMLDLEQDMEADLGIDSIKRVEIIGALQKQLPEPASAAMGEQMEAFTAARTLSALIGNVQPLLAGPAANDAAAPAAAASQPPPANVDLRPLLLGTVAELTGYPEDMLDADQDLEADLGIDSIKRVEILGALQKQLPADIAATMGEQMETFTAARSLSEILAKAQALLASTAAPAATADTASTGASTTASTAATTAAVDVRGLLLTTVADLTGYPEDMIGADQALEADLGIDSIKRVEILGALGQALPAPQAAMVQAQMEALTQAPTIDAIVALIDSAATDTAASPAATAPTSTAESTAASTATSPTDTADAPVYLTQPVTLPALPVVESCDATVLLCGLDSNDMTALADHVNASGATALRAGPDGLPEADQLARVTHVIDTTGVCDPSTAEASLHGLLAALHALEDGLAGLHIVAVSRLGGSFGRDGVNQAVSPIAGAANGIFNCLRKEYPGLIARAVDVAAELDAQRLAECALAEVLADEDAFETGYPDGDTRLGFGTVAAQLPAGEPVTPTADWVTLVTGGARGITASVVERLVVPGMRLVLLGRSPLPGDEDAAFRDSDDAGLKTAVINQAKAAGETIKPAEVNRRVTRLLADREIRANLARLDAAGATVDYRTCDVSDAQAFGALIDTVYGEFGHIDAVIHGAGVIEDKLFRDKTADSFARVFATKVNAARVLADKLDGDTTKLCVFFASVAGRFGNRGQADYAAANETLTRLACQLDARWPATRVMAVSWGPWDAGMASDAVKQQFREQGIVPIPVAAGCETFADLLSAASPAEVIVGRGPWPQPPQATGVAGASGEAHGTLPLIRAETRMGPGGAISLDHTFTVDNDPYLGDHRLDDIPVLPAAGAAEWMAEVVAAGWPDWQVTEIVDLRVLSGVRLVNGQRAVHIKARAAAHSDPGSQSIAVEIEDAATRQGLYKATVVLAPEVPAAEVMTPPTAIGGEAFVAATVYRQHLFHTGCFQLIDAVNGVDGDGVDARAYPADVGEWLKVTGGDWLFDPGLLDVGPQLAIVWSRSQHDRTALPSRFGRVRRYGRGAIDGPVTLHLRLRTPSDGSTVHYDVWMLDADGRLRLSAEDMSGTMTSALNRLSGAQQ